MWSSPSASNIKPWRDPQATHLSGEVVGAVAQVADGVEVAHEVCNPIFDTHPKGRNAEQYLYEHVRVNDDAVGEETHRQGYGGQEETDDFFSQQLHLWQRQRDT